MIREFMDEEIKRKNDMQALFQHESSSRFLKNFAHNSFYWINKSHGILMYK